MKTPGSQDRSISIKEKSEQNLRIKFKLAKKKKSHVQPSSLGINGLNYVKAQTIIPHNENVQKSDGFKVLNNQKILLKA